MCIRDRVYSEEMEVVYQLLNHVSKKERLYAAKVPVSYTHLPCEEQAEGAPGMVKKLDKEAIYINTGEGVLKVTQLQLEGKKRMQVKDFLLGCRMEKGEMLGC